jgi:hypothetical protein
VIRFDTSSRAAKGARRGFRRFGPQASEEIEFGAIGLNKASENIYEPPLALVAAPDNRDFQSGHHEHSNAPKHTSRGKDYQQPVTHQTEPGYNLR